MPKVLLLMIGVPDGGWVEGIRRAIVLVLITGIAIEQAPSVGPLLIDGEHQIRNVTV